MRKNRGVHMLCIAALIGSFFNYGQVVTHAEQLSCDPAEMTHFIDDYMTDKIKKKEIVGATVAVIKGADELLKKGYGYSNLEERIPIDSDQTTMPIASVSKLFTATAVMQLRSEGKIDLKEDVQNYTGSAGIIATAYKG